MKWKNVQFGEFEYDSAHVLQFPEGLIGFEECGKFILINDDDSQPFLWLVSLEDPILSFPLIDPFAVVHDYTIDKINLHEKTVLVLASLREKLEESTVNLRSPLIIENTTQHGRQVLLENEAYQFQHPLFASALNRTEE